MTRLAVVVMLAAGCGGNRSEPAGAGSAVATANSAAPPTSSAAAPSPLSPKVAAARCGEPCLFLVDTPIAQLTDAYRTACGGMTTQDLGFDNCKQLDYARNCIYAAHGFVYKKGRWKTTFTGKPWYDGNPAIDAKTVLSTLELANVHELHERGKACRKNLDISGADYDRIKAWFGALPARPPLPKVVFVDGFAGTGKAFMDLLQNGEDSGAADGVGTGQVALGGKVIAVYVTGDLHDRGSHKLVEDMPAAMIAAIRASDESKLRVIRVRFPEDTDDDRGTDVFFVYDDADALRGIEVHMFAYVQ